MKLNHYQELASKTNCYDKAVMLGAMCSGIAAEAGEVNGKYNKWLRGDMNWEELKEALIKESGDCMWFLSELMRLLEVPLDYCAFVNIEKLADRAKRGTIKGSGDLR